VRAEFRPRLGGLYAYSLRQISGGDLKLLAAPDRFSRPSECEPATPFPSSF
jgi:hypothetical protein